MKIPRLDLTSVILLLLAMGSLVWIVSDIRKGIIEARAKRQEAEIRAGVNAYYGTNRVFSPEEEKTLKSISAEQSK